MTNQEKFIKNAYKIHGDKYDYSRVKYIGIRNKVTIVCPIHGVFEQTPHHHVCRKQGCGNCRYIDISKRTRSTKNDFIKKAKITHGNKYDYSLVEYANAKTKVKIICPKHGIFEQTPDNHVNGQTCGKCNGLYKTNESIISEANVIHGNLYNYSLLDYKAMNLKVKIICPIHGIFEQRPEAHIRLKQGCPKCVGLNKTTEEFIKEAKLIHGDKYDYSQVEYLLSKKKINIICQTHGVFEQTPNDHLRNKGCPICQESKGEKQIRCWLKEKGLKFIPQYRFLSCKNVNTLPFDFYLPEINICIEYDGVQHFKPITYFGGKNGLLKIKHNDSIKTKFCLNNNIKLIRIQYNKNIYDLLNKSLIIS